MTVGKTARQVKETRNQKPQTRFTVRRIAAAGAIALNLGDRSPEWLANPLYQEKDDLLVCRSHPSLTGSSGLCPLTIGGAFCPHVLPSVEQACRWLGRMILLVLMFTCILVIPNAR
ncbi:MAG: hypothetical protein Fur0046_10050 [Cyanobacteria bacterium J069]